MGVGSLPGNISEISVAKLPEERRQECLPSHDSGPLGKTDGVGALPGNQSETSVAKLPEEHFKIVFRPMIVDLWGSPMALEPSLAISPRRASPNFPMNDMKLASLVKPRPSL
jgi:hypothetical protein